MDNKTITNYQDTDIEEYLRKQMDSSLWNLGLIDQGFPVELGAGNPQWSPLSGASQYKDQPDAPGSVQEYDGAPQAQTSGLQPHVSYARNLIVQNFGIQNIGGYSYRNINGTTKLSDHARGLALDVMVSPQGVSAVGQNKDKGDQVAAWAKVNRSALHVKYIIWYNQFMSENTNWQWESYTKHGPAANQQSVTGRHEDHVHISFQGLP